MTKGTYSVIPGDATKPQRDDENEIVVIPHVCNNIRGWGKGFVLALDKISPEPKKIYQQHLEQFRDPRNSLGEVCTATIDEKTYVANMIAQNGVVGPDNKRPLKYWALVKCMQTVLGDVGGRIQGIHEKPFAIHCPKFGSALAKGNWTFIEELIEELWIDKGFDVTVYEYKE